MGLYLSSLWNSNSRQIEIPAKSSLETQFEYIPFEEIIARYAKNHFNAISEASISKTLGVEDDILDMIAQYSSGSFECCTNCKADIHIPWSDEEYFAQDWDWDRDDDQEFCLARGYKTIESDFYCKKCMGDVKIWWGCHNDWCEADPRKLYKNGEWTCEQCGRTTWRGCGGEYCDPVFCSKCDAAHCRYCYGGTEYNEHPDFNCAKCGHNEYN